MKLPRWREWSTGARVAALLLAVALVGDLVEIVRMERARDDAPPVPLVISRVSHIVTRAPDDSELIREAANRTLFDAPPAPGSLVAANVILQSSVPAPPARPKLVGTVVQGGGGFVVLELPNTQIQLVHVGERAGELRLRSVAAGEAVFDDLHGGRVSLRTPRAGSGPEIRP